MVEQNTNSPPTGEAKEVVVQKTKISMVWIVPIVVLGLGATIIYQTLRDAGVPITLTFVSADGLEAGKTKIRFKDVDIGQVEMIRVSDDATHVILDVVVERHGEKYLKETARFWVVRPRVTLQGITGLGTLLSGAYINIDPGTGNPKRAFKGMEVPPVLKLGSDARQFVLHADELGSVNVGSPIIYRGFEVGEVLSYKMMDDDAAVEIKFFVRHPHHDLVFTESKFWDVSGMEVRAGADGIDVKIASMASLMTGGIAFETSKLTTKRVPAEEHSIFRLHRHHSDIDYFEKMKREICFHFEDSLRGLSVGAPIEFRGIKIGEVTNISAEFNEETMEINLPVKAVIEPERFAMLGGKIEADDKKAVERLTRFIQFGMRAQLKTGNLISGALFIDLVMDPESPIRLVGGPDAEIPEVPTIRSSSEQIIGSIKNVVIKLDRFMTQIEKLDIAKLIDNAAGAAEGIEKLVESDDLKGSVKGLKTLIEEVQPVMKDLDKLIVSVDSEIAGTMTAITDILKQAEESFVQLNGILANDSPMQTDIRDMLEEIAGMARSLRNLTAYLERHPEALLKGKPGGN